MGRHRIILGCRNRYGATFMLIVVLGAGFWIGRLALSTASAEPAGLVGQDGRGNLPGPDETPVPGTTPDTSKPFWYIPYLNQDRLAAKFHGNINGIEVGATSGPVMECEQVYRPDWEAAIAGTAFATDFSSLPAGISLASAPEVVFCDDGRPLRMEAVMDVGAQVEGAGPGGAQIAMSRVAGVRWWREAAPPERWHAGVIDGQPAALLDQPFGTIAESAVFVLDTNGGSTRFKGLGTTLALTKLVAEALDE